MPEATEPKHAEEALRASELVLVGSQSAKDGILILDAKTETDNRR